MTYLFKNDYTQIKFEEQEKAFYIKSISFFGKEYIHYEQGIVNSYVFLVGAFYPSKKLFNRYGSIGERLEFINAYENCLDNKREFIVEEKNENISVKTIYTLYNTSATLSVKKELKNISNEEITLECVTPLTLNGIMTDVNISGGVTAMTDDVDVTSIISPCGMPLGEGIRYMQSNTPPKFWKAHNTWCCEAVLEQVDLKAEGLRGQDRIKRAGKISVVGNGSQTTNRYLPLGIFEKEKYGYFMFEILPVGSWSYEIEAGMSMGEDENEMILALTGKNLCDNGWYKCLKPNEQYQTEEVRIVGSQDIDGLLGEMAAIRRETKRKIKKQPYEEVIYNVFQSNCWANPSEKLDEKWIPMVADTTADYYVIDAGWFDEGNTQAVGVWDENSKAYPSGVIATAQKIREKGMKFGLWLELQSVGVKCTKKDLLPEHCYFHTNGKRTICNGRYQINYALPEVREYASKIIEKVINRYNPDYIKIDYNQTQLGNDNLSGSLADGLATHALGYYQWFSEIQDKYPDIIFEACASGGMCMDSKSASYTTVFSATDQGIYYNMPPILANLPLAILPEQMGIWCVPVYDSDYPHTTDEKVIMSVVNALYGVMHLCSKIDALTEKQNELLLEGINYYRELAKIKENAIPIMPNGFANFDDKIVMTGLRTKEKLYISVFNVSEQAVKVKKDFTSYNVEKVELSYPRLASNAYELNQGDFSLELAPMSARAFELRRNPCLIKNLKEGKK